MDAELDRAEFQALRDTIRERGTRRVTLFWATTAFWATLLTAAIGLVAFAPTIGPRAGAFLTLVSLLPLAAGFEAVFALHVGVERIGRYLQVFYEGREPLPAWERTAMAIGPTGPKGLTDPLFSAMFAAGRVGGWTAHVLEQLANNRLIRPSSEYVGPRGLKYVPIEQR